jgi:DNA polymerase-4
VSGTKHLAKIGRRWPSLTGWSSSIPRLNSISFTTCLSSWCGAWCPITKARSAEIGVLTIGQLAKSREGLRSRFSATVGQKLAALAWNRDPREIETHRRARSAGARAAIGKKPAEGAGFPTHAASPRGQGRQQAPR